LIAFASSLDQVGPFAANVRDAALLLEVIAGHDQMDSTSIPQASPSVVDVLDDGGDGLRVGIIEELSGEGIAPDVLTQLHAAATALEKAGAIVAQTSVLVTHYRI